MDGNNGKNYGKKKWKNREMGKKRYWSLRGGHLQTESEQEKRVTA